MLAVFRAQENKTAEIDYIAIPAETIIKLIMDMSILQ